MFLYPQSSDDVGDASASISPGSPISSKGRCFFSLCKIDTNVCCAQAKTCFSRVIVAGDIILVNPEPVAEQIVYLY